jgi:hypothetical protein
MATVLIRARSNVAWWRIYTIALVIQVVLLLLIKIVLQNLFHLKYIVTLPEIGLNV